MTSMEKLKSAVEAIESALGDLDSVSVSLEDYIEALEEIDDSVSSRLVAAREELENQ